MIVAANYHEPYGQILTSEALAFLKALHVNFSQKRADLLSARIKRQEELDKGIMPQPLRSTSDIREKNWTVAPVLDDLLDRRVEITGPVERKMIINALNSGAKVFMADFEDSNTPSWSNL
ncbi:MAG: malate synthase A, partial [Bacteroidota bacterium]